jgi:hypothetical protein
MIRLPSAFRTNQKGIKVEIDPMPLVHNAYPTWAAQSVNTLGNQKALGY